MKKKRISENFRKTSETEIYCKVNIDGKGRNKILHQYFYESYARTNF